MHETFVTSLELEHTMNYCHCPIEIDIQYNYKVGFMHGNHPKFNSFSTFSK